MNMMLIQSVSKDVTNMKATNLLKHRKVPCFTRSYNEI